MTETHTDIDAVAVPPGGEKAVSLKLLATNIQAGAIIGKSGSTISEMQSVSKATIQISRANELFMGTTERIMQVSGQLFNVVSALHLMLQKWSDENVWAEMDVPEGQVLLKVVTLGRLCGAVIGEGGKTIKDIKESTSCDIRVQSREQAMPGMQERIITVIGAPSKILTAVSRIMQKFLEDPSFENYRTQPLTQFSGALNGLQNLRLSSDDPLSDVPCSWTMLLSNEQAGAVLGVKGKTIEEILRSSHASVRVQGRAEVQDGEPRELRIEGNLEQCTLAISMVVAKLSASNRSRRGDHRGEHRGEREPRGERGEHREHRERPERHERAAA